MPGRGPAPKAKLSRANDENRRAAEFRTLVPDDVVRGPELPDGVIQWPPQTVALYEALRRDPGGQTLTDADWLHVVDTMLLHADLWSGNPRVAGEIRLRLGQLGITPEARMRLRLLIDTGDREPEGNLARLQRIQREKEQTARKRRILKTVSQTATGKA